MRLSVLGAELLAIARILVLSGALWTAAFLAAPRDVGAQSEYRNVDGGRPVRVEDALATPLHAMDIQLASARVERIAADAYRVLLEPRLAYGVLPQTELTLRAPFAFRERGVTPRQGLVGVGVGLFHAINLESTTLPALAVEGEIVPSAGGAVASGTTFSGRAIATRTFERFRIHVNVGGGNYRVPIPGADVSTPYVPDAPCSIATDRQSSSGAARDGLRPLGPMASCSSRATLPAALPVDRQSGDRAFGGIAVDKTLPLTFCIAHRRRCRRSLRSADQLDGLDRRARRSPPGHRTVGDRRNDRASNGIRQVDLDRVDWCDHERGVADAHSRGAMSDSGATDGRALLGSRRECTGRRALPGLAAVVCAAVLVVACGGVYPQFYFPAPHNWAFRDRYPAADRLFNAFDYGHAIVSEVLYESPRSAPVELEHKQFELLTHRILLHPPNVALDEAAIAPGFTKLAPEVDLTFEWAHMLHRQIYDVLADERIKPADRDVQVARLVAYYRSRADLALSSTPKSMQLMEGQPYSGAFRRVSPRVNGLIWSYHWLQVGLYDALLSPKRPSSESSWSRMSSLASCGCSSRNNPVCPPPCR